MGVTVVALNRCINCKALPVIRELPLNDPYNYVLVHDPALCPGEYCLISEQMTREDCIRDWNQFNEHRRE